MSARQVARETGISQETVSRWLRQGRCLPTVTASESAKLTGAQLSTFLEREGLLLAELEQSRQALGDETSASITTTKRMRKLERELARKEKAVAEAAALLVLKKVEHPWEDEDEGTDETSET